ncbi:hypothetical protein RI129_008827 [Pyrocoelia pectoralis]|uniref:thioredoxin-dependent peroxiredoxin n=1 Tax=Pyrocoelia pectoralis TaxID=417401 RepID=A0AAN7V684_9COLE
MVKVDEFFPNFQAKTTTGPIDFYEWMENSWCLLVSYNFDFNAICTSELAKLAEMNYQFKERNVKLIAVSCNLLHSHVEWMTDIRSYINFNNANPLPYPIISDEKCDLALELNTLEHNLTLLNGVFKTSRASILVDPNKRTRLSMTYPSNVGRNFDEIIRIIDALQVVDGHQGVATPAHWKAGQDVIITSNIPDNKLFAKFPYMTVKVLPSGKTRVRKTHL